MIMKGRAPLRLPWAGFIALAVVAMATLPAWASVTVNNDQQPAPATTVAQQPTPVPPVAPAPAQAKPQPTTTAAPTAAPARKVTPAPASPHVTAVQVTPHPQFAVDQTTPPTRHVAVAPVPHTQERVTTPRPSQRAAFSFMPAATELTEEGQKLIEKFNTQREAIQKEVDAKVEAERQTTIKQLQALQDQYARSGKLDEAVAIRDYLKAGGPSDGSKMSWVIRRTP